MDMKNTEATKGTEMTKHIAMVAKQNGRWIVKCWNCEYRAVGGHYKSEAKAVAAEHAK